PNANGSWESAIVTGAEKSAIDVIGPQLGDLIGVATLTRSDQDIMLARWRPRPSSKWASIWVWDTPEHNDLVLDCPIALFHDPEAAQRFLKELIVWDLTMTKLNSVHAKFCVGDCPVILIGTGDVFPFRPYEVGFSLRVMREREHAYVVLETPKRLFAIRHYPEGASFV